MSDIAIRFGFVETKDSDGDLKKEPAMGLYPVRSGAIPMYAIPLSSAYKYAEPGYLLASAFGIAEFFSMFPDQFLVNRIADLILNYLPDLIRMRPAPEEEGEVNGEGVIILNGDRMTFGTTTTGGVVH